jgi:hypothetical protein
MRTPRPLAAAAAAAAAAPLLALPNSTALAGDFGLLEVTERGSKCANGHKLDATLEIKARPGTTT